MNLPSRRILPLAIWLIGQAQAAESVEARHFLDDALAKHRTTSSHKMTMRSHESGMHMTTYMHRRPEDFFFSYRRTENRNARGLAAAQSVPQQLILSAGNDVWVLSPAKALAIKCEFRNGRMPKTTVPVNCDLSKFESFVSERRTIDGVKFRSITRTLNDGAQELIQSLDVDSYYLLYGLTVNTGTTRPFKVKQMVYLIREDNLNIHGWKMIGEDLRVIIEEQYDTVEAITLPDLEMFTIPESYKQVSVKTHRELMDLINGMNLRAVAVEPGHRQASDHDGGGGSSVLGKMKGRAGMTLSLGIALVAASLWFGRKLLPAAANKKSLIP